MSNPAKILVIDDEEVGRQLLEAILTPEDYDVIFGENGEQGLDLAYSEQPDIILCDVMMPGIDGFEVCKKLRGEDKTAHIPIFLITALDDRDSRIRGIDAGADDYISKPLDRVEILAKIKNSLNRLQSIKQNNVAPETFKPGDSQMKPILLEGLLLTVSDDIEKDSKIELFRSSRKLESNHLFSKRHFSDRVFYYLVSNSLKSTDAVILNSTLISLLYQNSVGNLQNINEIINKTLSQKDKILNSADLNDNSPVKISIVAIMKNTGENIITCSGINQKLLIDSNENETDSDAKPNFQSHHLSSHQDIDLKESDQIVLLSPNITGQVNQTELCAYVNEEIVKKGEERITSKIADKFNQIQDVIVVKLTF